MLIVPGHLLSEAGEERVGWRTGKATAAQRRLCSLGQRAVEQAPELSVEGKKHPWMGDS